MRAPTPADQAPTAPDTDEQVIARFKELEHFLTDVWDWPELLSIGLEMDEDREEQWNDRYWLSYQRDLESKLTQHLATRYMKAVERIDEVFALSAPSELGFVLSEKLRQKLIGLQDGRVQFFHATGSANEEPPDPWPGDDPTEEELAGAESSNAFETDHLSQAWGNVGKDVTFFLDKVGAKIERLRSRVATSTGAVAEHLERIQWQGSTIEFVTVIRSLVRSQYIDLPSKNGQGDGNETELYRRLQQVILVRNSQGKEIRPEGIMNRAVGRPIGGARERQFELPEATRKKVGKGKRSSQR